MLHTIAKLTKHDIRNVERVLTDEVDANTLRADQAHHLFDLLLDRRLDVRK